MPTSPNFDFLKTHDPQLTKLGAVAELYFKEDPVTCLMKLRQFGELLAQLTAANVGLYADPEEPQLKLLHRLRESNLLPGEVGTLFHELRRAGNEATHQRQGDYRTALSNLKYARQLGIWFHRTFSGDSHFKPGAFIPPPDPTQETVALKQELERLRVEAQQAQAKVLEEQAKAQEELELRQIAEELLEESAAQQRLAQIQSQAASQSGQLVQQTVSQAQRAERYIDLDETETRRLIDAQLRAAGWEADQKPSPTLKERDRKKG